MTLKDLKKEDKMAREMLILLWSELSGISKKEAKRDLKKEMSDRYLLSRAKGGTLVFDDLLTGDTFEYSTEAKVWKYLEVLC